MSFYFVFIDGIGIDKPSEHNPFSKKNWSAINSLANNQTWTSDADQFQDESHLFRFIDANLGVEGLPQSGTGQTALFTGENISQRIGKHFGPFPHSSCKPILREKSIFADLKKKGLNPYFINAYPPPFFEYAKKRNRWSCSTFMVREAGYQLNSTDAVFDEKALTAEIIQRYWREKLNINLPKITAEQGGERFYDQGRFHDLTFFEFYLTDKAGHEQKPDFASEILGLLDGFFKGILNHFDVSKDTLLISSDHGNLEDLSTKTHTRNAVPLVVYGKYAQEFKNVESILGVKDALLKSLI